MNFSVDSTLVVVPWDFSEMSREALIKAVEMVKDPDLIRVVHVAHIPPAIDYGITWAETFDSSIRDRAIDNFRETFAEKPEFANLSFTVLLGDPGSEICRFARDFEAGLILMPSHGRTGISRMLLGSVTERVVRLAPCPVLVIRSSSVELDDEPAGNAAASA